jgi:hypothetical protein
MRVFRSAVTWYWAVAFAAASYVWYSVAVEALRHGNGRGGAGLAGDLGLGALAAIALGAAVAAVRRNRAALAQSAWPMRIVRAAGGVLGTWLVLVLSFTAAAFLVPTYADDTPRAKYVELLLYTAAARTGVMESAGERRGLSGSGEGLTIGAGGRLSAGIVSANGVVVAYSEPLRAVAVLVPQWGDGRVERWRCMGLPRKIVPDSCRDRDLLPARSTLDRGIEGSERDHAAALRELAAALQSEVAAAFRARKALSGSVRERALAASGPLDFGYLSANGAAALYSDRHGVYLQLTPSVKGNALEWDCVAYPAAAAPDGCRSPMTAQPL